MNADALIRWKAQIFSYQQQVRESQPPQQPSLFDLAPTHYDPDSLDPFSLNLNRLRLSKAEV
jgi:hypothetical protein